MSISLSILEYEPELSEKMSNLKESRAFVNMMKLIRTGLINEIHVDVMRPPLVPGRSKFSVDLIKRLYEELIKETCLNIHLMTNDPLKIIEDINKFVAYEDRAKIATTIQVEAFSSEDEALEAARAIKGYGYRVGIGLNLPTPEEKLDDDVVREAQMILVMSVPMGLGGQKYHKEATERLRRISRRFPDKIIVVDGGINPDTIVEAFMAGAKVAVVGSYITLSANPVDALLRIYDALSSLKTS